MRAPKSKRKGRKTEGNVATSVQAIARDYGIHVDSVRRLIHSGELRAIRVGKRSFRILVADLEKFLKSRQTN